MTAATFQYAALEKTSHLRLIRVDHISGDTNEVWCSLVHVDRHSERDTHPWTALSYRWGNEDDLMPLHINHIGSHHAAPQPARAGVEKTYQDLWVPRSTVEMLISLHLNKQIEGKWVWLDYVALNQSDLDEKGAQIKQMGEVYSHAAETIVYLGPELPTTALAMDFWRRLEAIRDSMPQSQIEGEPLQIAPQELLDKSGTTWGDSEWTALCEHLTHPWFGRLWMIQEAVLSGTLLFVCGRFLLAWQDLVKLRDLVKYAGIDKILIDVGGSRAWTSVSAVSRIAMLKENRAGANLGWQAGLSFVVYNCDAAVASDPRDHIFGVLGLIHGTRSVRDRDEIQINYHDSTAKVFTDATAGWTLRHDSFDIVYAGGVGRPDRLLGLPSWVPDFSQTLSQYPGQHLRAGKGNISALIQPLSVEKGDLSVQMYQTGIVTQVMIFDSQPNHSSWLEIDPAVLWYISAAWELVTQIHGSEWPMDVYEAFWRTLVRNSEVDTLASGGIVPPPGYGEAFADIVSKSNVANTQRQRGQQRCSVIAYWPPWRPTWLTTWYV